MASIIHETELSVPAERAWGLLEDVGAAHRAFPGVLTACRLEGGERVASFANGMEVRERIITVDAERRRIAYAVVGGRFTHHAASMQLIDDGRGGCRFVWTSDFLPDVVEPAVRALVEQGSQAFRRIAQEGR